MNFIHKLKKLKHNILWDGIVQKRKEKHYEINTRDKFINRREN